MTQPSVYRDEFITEAYETNDPINIASTINKYRQLTPDGNETIVSIDWNSIDEAKENELYKFGKENFWVPDKFLVSEDKLSLSMLTEDELYVIMKNYQSLSLLDTIQSTLGIYSVMGVSPSHKAKAVLSGFDYIEFIHTDSYPYIFTTLLDSPFEARIRRWEKDTVELQAIQLIIRSFYKNANNDPLLIKIASVVLEGIIFYSGFYMPIYLESRGIMIRTAELIRTIVRDENIHTKYVSYLYLKEIYLKTEKEKEFYYNRLRSLINDLYPVLFKFVNDLYGIIGLEKNVMRFVNYNINRTFQMLGYQKIITDLEASVDEVVLTALSETSVSSHNFFTKPGSSYYIAPNELLLDEDFKIGL